MRRNRPGWRPTRWHHSGAGVIRWEHYSGWVVEHQGHATAHNPWAVYSPEGRMLLTGGWEKGTAFKHLDSAQQAAELEEHKRAVEKHDG